MIKKLSAPRTLVVISLAEMDWLDGGYNGKSTPSIGSVTQPLGHSYTIYRHLEMVKLLVGDPRVNINRRSGGGFTGLAFVMRTILTQ
jgi:hypothetical protein